MSRKVLLITQSNKLKTIEDIVVMEMEIVVMEIVVGGVLLVLVFTISICNQ
jgi:hypothetical protein